METWKVKGVVPDSDDEEELESQSVGASAEQHDGDLDQSPRELQEPREPETDCGQIDIELPRAETNTGYNECSAILPSEKAVSKANTSHRESPRSSPQRFFMDPRALLTLDATAESQILPNIHRSQSNFDIPAADDICTSYVRLTSPMSSPLSSPPQSQLDDPDPEIFEHPSSPRNHLAGPTRSHSPAMGDLLPALESPMDYSVRNFRQRNPIQLRPYVVEQERYRRTLRARGMTPMRIAQAADEQSKKSRHMPEVPESQESESQEPESQEPESQELELGESQPMDIDPNYDLRPSSQSTIHESRGDEDFPDINELLRNQQSLSHQSELRRRPKQYSSKSNRSQTSKATGQLSRSIRRIRREDGIFDVPASPPQTSSPLSEATHDTRSPNTWAMPHSPSAFEEDELVPHKITDLLTPATSVVKPVSDPVLIDLASDEDDPFASEPSASLSSLPSSSDESVGIRKVSKRIRGVLPASHLRLDHQVKTSRSAGPSNVEYAITTSVREPVRRGIALPTANKASRTPSPADYRGMLLFSEDSDEGDDEASTTGLMMEIKDNMMPDLFSQQRIGFAEEDDKVDAMLPSRKRRERHQGTHPRKRQRVGGASLQGYRAQTRQLYITEHLLTSRNQDPSQGRKSRYSEEPPRRSHGVTSRARNVPAPPKLGILDVLGVDGQDQNEAPQFIKVAARAARSKKNYGRQSPSKKFIRLASRDDTCDVQSVLQNWRNGSIRPRDLRYISREHSEASRVPLNPIPNNQQTAFRPPQAISKSRFESLRLGERYNPQPRKLSISRAKQTSMNDFVTSEPSYQRPSQHVPQESLPTVQKRQQNHQFATPKLWPAQLESSEAEYSHRYPATAFGSRKKALDSLYKVARKHQAPQSNIQLSRFLANEVTRESTVDNESLPGNESIANASSPVKKLSKSRKRPPQRIDVGAAVYRQPSEPLVLELLAPAESRDNHEEENRLQGLGKFGTRYTNHFDIFPLQSGIFFHESTFIGGGRLLEVLKDHSLNPPELFQAPMSYHIGEKTFKWEQWNEDVSSEVGVLFDWIVDHLNQPSLSTMTRDHVVGTATFVVDYVQQHMSFVNLQQQNIISSRIMIVVAEALNRLEPKSNVVDEPQLQSRIEVTSIWTVLVMQLLLVSRRQPSQSSTNADLERLLVTTAGHCIGFLISKGFESIRKLYDDLQYLSFRTNGIKKDQYAVHSWVMMIKILEVASIPRGSFWDVANTLLLDPNVRHLNDARSMEKTWYSIFTLLPLCEFDESGVVIAGQRQNVSFDNWLLPQNMLKSVFALYSSGSRQSPSFNDYFRALVRRCHYLIVEWGWWKCNGIIGVIFDFFTSRNLGHLRNEEVYKSPQFLEELNTEPPLAVELDDRCFHIFLKIVALAIKHMCGAKERKNIRNLVFRLLPNHDRQYPKEENLDTRDLASLRNHHDLLCTLYWAALPEYRPSLTQIQDLVIADRSHNEACLINLRAWQQLSRFIFTSYTTSDAFQPFITWQNSFWFKLLNQFLEEDSNTRKQAALLEGELITETALQRTITNNKASTMALMRSSMNAVGLAILSSTSSDAAMTAFNIRIINSVFSLKDSEYNDSTESLIADTIDILRSYMKQIEKLHPLLDAPSQSRATMPEDDSQGSLGIGVNVDRQMMIFPLSEEIQPCLRHLAHQILEGDLYHAKDPHFMQAIIETWTQLVCLTTEDSSGLKDFLPGGQSAIFQHRHGCKRANKYWPLFLGELLRCKTVEELEHAGFDIGLEWVLALTIPMPEPAYLNRFTLSMFEKKHPFVKPFPNMAVVLRSPCLATGWLSRHLIQGAIDVMRETSKSSTQILSWSHTANMFPKRDFSYVLKEVLDSMQHELKAMGLKSPDHRQYMIFCQGIAEDIRSRGSEIFALSDFFITPSIYYWPAEGDPKLFAASIISYSLRLHEQSGRTTSELFHYLYRGWRSDLIHGRLKNHVSYIKKGLKHWSFIEFALTDFVPAALHVGFNSDFGWILCSSYLPPLADRISKLLDRSDSQARVTLAHLSTILKIIMNGCMQQYSRWQKSIRGIHPLHRGIVSVACQFWLALIPVVKGYVDRHPNGSVLIDEVNSSLTTFAQETVRAFDGSFDEVWEVNPFDIIEDQQVRDAAGVMMNDCDKNWTLDQTVEGAMQSKNGILSIGGYGARDSNKPTVNLERLWPCTLHEVLETGRPHFQAGLLHPLPINRLNAATTSHRFITEVFF